MNFKALILVFGLVGCTTTGLNTDTVNSASDSQLCDYLNTTKLPVGTLYNTVKIEQEARNLDCHPHHAECLSFGLQKGTDAYADCRMRLYQAAQLKAVEDEKLRIERHKLRFPEKSSSTSSTNCNVYGSNINCTTRQRYSY